MPSMQQQQLTLISHKLCPYVQRAVTVLEEVGLPYKRVDIDLGNKPEWFKKLSPLGKVPLLVIDDDTVLFESAVISEYINDISGGELLPGDPLAKANAKSWVEFASASLNNIGQLYNAVDEKSFLVAAKEFNAKFSHLEESLPGSSFSFLPSSSFSSDYFNGDRFSLVDAAFAPVFRYLDLFEQWGTSSFLTHYPKISAWRKVLFARPTIKAAVREDYPKLLTEFVAKRPSYLGGLAKEYLANSVATV